MEDFYEAIGRRISKLRKTHGLSQEQLAEKASIAASYVAHIEAGARKPTLAVLDRIAKALSVRIGRLIDDDRLSADEIEWGSRARELAADCRDLSAGEIGLLHAMARQLKKNSAGPSRSRAKR